MSKPGRRLTVDDQLNILGEVWDEDHEGGYVFLPWIKGDTQSKEERKKNYHEGQAYAWPAQRDKIKAHLEAHTHDDVYFCPMVFNGRHRASQLADREIALWADLDPIDPRSDPRLKEFKPTIAWETSPGRYQAIWILNKSLIGAAEAGGENQRLTYYLDADKGGWDITQLLRIPGRRNFKPEYRDEDGTSAPGRLLWRDGPRYDGHEFAKLPEVVIGSGADDELVEELLDQVDRIKVWKRVRLKCSQTVREYVAYRGSEVPDGVDRSEVLWQIERDLADAGCTLAEIVAVVRPLVWNKHSGRADELRYLKNEASKAIAEKVETLEDTFEEVKPEKVQWLLDWAAKPIPRPQWLVDQIWARGSCGFIAGAAKSYKSWLGMDLMISLATGEPFLGEYKVRGGPHKVLYLQEEDSEGMVKDRLEKVIEGRAPNYHWSGRMVMNGQGVIWEPARAMPLALYVGSGFVASDEGWQAWLDEIIEAEKFDFILIDTLSTTIGVIDTDKSIELMNRVLKPLKTLAQKHDCAVAIIHHNKKEGELKDGSLPTGRAGMQMMGAQALHAWVDNALYVRARRDKARLPGHTPAVSGVEVFVERESKQAPEMKFIVGIPLINRTVREGVVGVSNWAPVVSAGWNDAGDTSLDTHGRSEGRERRPNTTEKRPANAEGSRGYYMAMKLKEMGATTENRAKTKDEMYEILGADRSRRSGISGQVTRAVNHGLIIGVDDRFYVDLKTLNESGDR